MTPVAKSAKLARLKQAYDALDPAGREIVDVLSVLVMPVTRTLLQFCLMGKESPAIGRSAWNSKRLNVRIGDLLGSGLVEEVEKKKVRCLPSFREIPIRRVAREGRLDPLAAAVRPVLARNEPWHESRLYAYERSLRDFRIELYLRRWDLADQCLAACRQLSPPGADPLGRSLPLPATPTIDTLVRALALFWLAGPEDSAYADALGKICRQAHAGGYRLVEAEAAALLGAQGKPPSAAGGVAPHQPIGSAPLHMVLSREESWELTLAAMLDLFESGAGAKSAVATSAARLVWLLTWSEETCSLRPVEQRRTARGESNTSPPRTCGPAGLSASTAVSTVGIESTSHWT